MLDDFHRSILYVPEEGLVLSGGRAKDVASYSERNVPLTRTIAVDVKDKHSLTSTAPSLEISDGPRHSSPNRMIQFLMYGAHQNRILDLALNAGSINWLLLSLLKRR